MNYLRSFSTLFRQGYFIQSYKENTKCYSSPKTLHQLIKTIEKSESLLYSTYGHFNTLPNRIWVQPCPLSSMSV